jgi:hypothetical protein
MLEQNCTVRRHGDVKVIWFVLFGFTAIPLNSSVAVKYAWPIKKVHFRGGMPNLALAVKHVE